VDFSLKQDCAVHVIHLVEEQLLSLDCIYLGGRRLSWTVYPSCPSNEARILSPICDYKSTLVQTGIPFARRRGARSRMVGSRSMKTDHLFDETAR